VEAAVADVEAAVASQRVGSYANFVEHPADGSALFDGETWARLREVKRRYDGDDLFTGNFDVRPAE
jgi:hypothetical protein